jgi:LysR family glycine cleavage system transcriptional activator
LGLTQTAVSLHIKSLEATLGCKLFVRRARHLSLSEIGQAYLASVADALGRIDVATTSLFGPAAQQTITVRAPISTAELFLAPHLSEFSRSNPNIKVRLISTIWARSVADEDVDVDIRQGTEIGSGIGSGLEIEQLCMDAMVPIEACDAHSQSVEDPTFLELPLIRVLGYENMWDLYMSGHNMPFEPEAAGLSVDTTTVALALVAAGAGRAVVLERFAQGAVAAGMAISIVGEALACDQGHYLVRGKTQNPHRPEVEIVREWLRGIFNRTP